MDRLETLNLLLGTCLASITESEPDKRAALIREARAISKEIEELSVGAKTEHVSPLDEVRRKREERLKKAK